MEELPLEVCGLVVPSIVHDQIAMGWLLFITLV
jgi:hypothetical protein